MKTLEGEGERRGETKVRVRVRVKVRVRVWVRASDEEKQTLGGASERTHLCAHG